MKVFFDVLADYLNLKYIFLYGFYWDDQISKKVIDKGTRKIRELANVLEDEVYPNSACTAWYNKTKDKKAKKSRRMLVWKNHYRLEQDQWFQELYGCCGATENGAEREKVEKCTKGGPDLCGEDCERKRLCRLRTKEKLLLALFSEGRQPYVEEYKQLARDYPDIFETDKNDIRFRKNTWTRETMLKEGIFSCDREYDDFLRMIQFFAEFAPLSVLGDFFLEKLDENFEEIPFLARNLPYDFGLEQEYIYRSLYAIISNKNVNWQDKEYIPVRLKYREKNMLGFRRHLYLEAVDCETQERVMLPLFGGTYLYPHGSSKKAEISPDNREESGERKKFTVEFFYNDSTDYIPNRISREWKQEKVYDEEDNEHTVTFTSPYHPETTEWKIRRCTYEVAEEDVQGFHLFVKSFGDFAQMISQEDAECPVLPEIDTEKKGQIPEYQSLLSIYNSEHFLKNAKNFSKLPPRQAEVEWILFLLENYPNFCRIFLEDQMLDAIKEKIFRECKPAGWFSKENFDFSDQVKDIKKNCVTKYRKIFQAVLQQRVLHYEYRDRPVYIFPYALEYDMGRHLSRPDNGVKEPVDIMCYSLDEKRNLNILYKEIKAIDEKDCEPRGFSDYDKIYHVLAYALRCAAVGQEDIEQKELELLETFWSADSRGGDAYNRKIRKKFAKAINTDSGKNAHAETKEGDQDNVSAYKKEYEKLQKQMEKIDDKEGLTFLEKTFGYWKDNLKDDENFLYQYQYFLLKCFSDACGRYYGKRTGNDVKKSLDQINENDIWELIRGEEIRGVENEIAFYNERLKNRSVSFLLKEGCESEIDKVYEIFGDFLCTGEQTQDGRICFTVTYEGFYYRRLHMEMMALENLIEDIQHEETRQIIEQRNKNKNISRKERKM